MKYSEGNNEERARILSFLFGLKLISKGSEKNTLPDGEKFYMPLSKYMRERSPEFEDMIIEGRENEIIHQIFSGEELTISTN